MLCGSRRPLQTRLMTCRQTQSAEIQSLKNGKSAGRKHRLTRGNDSLASPSAQTFHFSIRSPGKGWSHPRALFSSLFVT
jgi:hypothetical protein